ncbi:hypothetical protein V8C35DRAFT_318080 [Trichoderma chlorosporum]
MHGSLFHVPATCFALAKGIPYLARRHCKQKPSTPKTPKYVSIRYCSTIPASPASILLRLEQLNAPSLWQSAWMICPRWTPRATATLANIGGSSRQGSSRHVLGPDPRLRRGFSTNGGGRGDGEFGSPSREAPQSSNNTRQKPPRRTAAFASTTGLRSNTLPRRRTSTPATSATDGSSLNQRPPNGSNKGDAQRPWASRTDRSSNAAEDEEWPQLRRRARGGKQEEGHARTSALTVPRNPFTRRHNVQNPRGTTDSSFVMLIIDGLSPNLRAADFYRITPNDLSHWHSVIKKVQQQRKIDTLEPLGRYWVTFSTAEAATSYRDRLIRLHKLNSFKLKSASGLWESSVPSSLKVSLASPPAAGPAAQAQAEAETSDAVAPGMPGAETLVDLVNTFTIAPGSQAVLPMQRKKVNLRQPWMARLAGLVERLGYGERPPTLMVEIYPPTLTAQELNQFIRLDGQNRGLRWQVSMPQPLKMNRSEQGTAKRNVKEGAGWDDETNEQEEEEEWDKPLSSLSWFNDRETLEKLRGRFVFACADETEARRFQQSWNHKTLTTTRPEPARYVVYASIINW